MEPRDRAPEEVTAARGPGGFRMLAAVALLVGLAFVQDPGFLSADTKFDLVAAPARFLHRALHLWDAQGAFGQLQNQAYGYLWPMGPFFLLGSVLDLPGWVVQRLWLGLVLAVAFVGAAKVCRALGARSDLACIVAGLAYALSPRMLTTLGPISIEAWPSALAPWVLLPLVLGSRAGSPRRAAALSALAVAMVGGVNAAATFAVLPLGVVWLLTRTPGPRRRSLMLWWPAFTALGTLWWLVPLFVMGAYTPPFLHFIETSSVTTFPTTLFDTLRGVSDWVPYVDPGSRAGYQLISTSFIVLNSGILLVVGFVGLIDRRNPHRLFLALSVLVGVVMVGLGHEGAVQGAFAGDLRTLLDGVLSPLRNVHKFDPILRLPLVVGLAFVLDRLVRRDPAPVPAGDTGIEQSLMRFNRAWVVAVTVLAVGGAAVPALTGRVTPSGDVLDVPGYWSQAAGWLARHDPDRTSLLLPGSPFADYTWGSPKDEPMQFLADTPWAVRNVIPLAPPGNIRMLDEVEDRLAEGRGSVGLTGYLRRAGVGYLVVRNDLRPGNDLPDPVLVHQALDESPGLSRVRSFGPKVGGGASLTRGGVRTVINGGWQSTYPAVEIYRVAGFVDRAVSTGSPTVVAGGPEDLLDLLDLGLVQDAPVVLAADRGAAPGLRSSAVVLTDGLRARERFFARIHDGYSAATTPGDRRRSGNPYSDYAIDNDHRWSTTARLDGAATVSASSSGADSNTIGGSRRGELPYAALDGSTGTAWVSGPGRPGRAWWRLGFARARSLPSVTFTGGPEASPNQTVRVTTDSGVSRVLELGPGETRTVPLGGRPVRWIRAEDAASSPGRILTLTEVTAPGLQVTRRLVLPELPTSWGSPDAIVLRADLDARTGCVRVDGEVRCATGKSHASEEPVGSARRVLLHRAGAFTPRLLVRPRPGADLDALVTRDQPANVAATSTAVADTRASALAAVDGDPGTTWTADVDDIRPVLSLTWLGTKRVTGLQVVTSRNVAARRPTRVTLTWPGGKRTVRLDARGRATFRPIRTDRMQVRVDAAETASSLDFAAQQSFIGVGISELRLTGVPYLPLSLPRIARRYPCGNGPALHVGDRTYRTSVTATPYDIAAGTPVPARVCTGGGGDRPLALAAGANDLSVASSPTFDFDSLVLTSTASTVPVATPTGLDVSGDATRGALQVQQRGEDSLVAVRQNANAGWRATQSGAGLAPVTVDGWQQGWVTDGSRAPVVARFAPDRAYRWGLGLGLLGLLALVLTVAGTVLRRRRRVTEQPAALTDRAVTPRATMLVAMVGALLVAGWAGLLVAVAVGFAGLVVQDRATDVAPWLLAAPCLLVAAGYSLTPWGSASGWAGSAGWPGYLMLVPLVSMLVLAGTGRPRFLSRIVGSSTKR